MWLTAHKSQWKQGKQRLWKQGHAEVLVTERWSRPKIFSIYCCSPITVHFATKFKTKIVDCDRRTWLGKRPWGNVNLATYWRKCRGEHALSPKIINKKMPPHKRTHSKTFPNGFRPGIWAWFWRSDTVVHCCTSGFALLYRDDFKITRLLKRNCWIKCKNLWRLVSSL